MKLPLCAYIFMLASGKSTMCFVEEKTSSVLCGHILLTEKVVDVKHPKLETVGEFYRISCELRFRR